MSEINKEIQNKIRASASFPDREIVASISCQAVSIGQCLENALRGLDSSDGDQDKMQHPKKRQKIIMDSEVGDRIMKSFGEAIADTQLQSNLSKSTPSAPRALLTGRLDHYNRVGHNWRILIDNVKLKGREQMPKESKKRGTKPSLWEECGNKQEEVVIEQKVQILAYNDSKSRFKI